MPNPFSQGIYNSEDKLRALFTEIDVDCSGYISHAELQGPPINPTVTCTHIFLWNPSILSIPVSSTAIVPLVTAAVALILLGWRI